MKRPFFFASILATGILCAQVVSAHVVVKPATAGVGAFETFDMGVPSEKSVSTVGVRLLIPAGLEYVSPNVKPGWKITMIKSPTDPNIVTEIDWTGNGIPAGERDDFVFSAKVPGAATTLDWKAYQTYSDGSVVSWDRSSSEEASSTDFSTSGPYSETLVVNDLGSPAPARDTLTLAIALVALVFGATALREARKAKRV